MDLIKDSHIGFVNLDHRSDRLTSMRNQLSKIGLNAVRYAGVLPHERTEEKSVMHAMLRRKQVGALGCYLAQLDIIKDAQSLGKHAWVMEDDVVFCEDFIKRIYYIDHWMHSDTLISEFVWQRKMTAIPREWDIIWLGGTFHVNPPYWHKDLLGKDAETTDDPRMIRTFGSFCTYAYIINRNSIEKVLSLLKERVGDSIGIDHSMIMISPLLKTFAFVPGCCKQYDNLSDQIPGSGDITTFSRFEKLGPYWYQERMEDFDPKTFDWAEARI